MENVMENTKELNLKELENATVCGYPIEQLVDFAQMCRQEGLEPVDLVRIRDDLSYCMDLCTKFYKDKIRAVVDFSRSM